MSGLQIGDKFRRDNLVRLKPDAAFVANIPKALKFLR